MIMNEQTLEMRGLHTYAEPLAGLRVSWGAILAGALASLGVSLLLWGLAFAIVVTVSSRTGAALRHDLVALWLSAILATLVGACAGGFLAGYLPGSGRRAIGGIHGFLSWAAAFLLVSMLEAVAVANVMNPRAGFAERAALEREATGMVGEDAPGRTMLAMLEALGYTRAEAARIVGGRAAVGALPMVGPRDEYRDFLHGPGAGRVLRAYGPLLAWSWFGTSAVSGALAIASAAGATRRFGGGPTGLPGAEDDTERFWEGEQGVAGEE
jgi:hypothetical protein